MSFQTVKQSIRIAAEPREYGMLSWIPKLGKNGAMLTSRPIGGPATQSRIEAVIGTKRYRDKGRVIKVQPPSLLLYLLVAGFRLFQTYPKSRSTITMTLEAEGTDATLTVEQQVPPSPVRRGEGWEIGEGFRLEACSVLWR